MKKSGYTEMYDKIYALFADTAPLKADCGLLCSRRCCYGAQDKGMLLFPGEETSLEVKENSGRRLAVCSGECERSRRPLSCMVFPFFPVIDERGKISVDFDYRGVSVCPLITNSEVISFNRKFFKNLLKAGKLLAKDAGCRKFLEEVTEEINEAKALYLKLEN
ncbi:MAG: hypothetical protein IKN56_01090 [Clostridia bacterium]|nr:hypothetical protein [Clostridia bacterium]MBR4451137.1 hypothetical protein [Clostridia bacterium]